MELNRMNMRKIFYSATTEERIRTDSYGFIHVQPHLDHNNGRKDELR